MDPLANRNDSLVIVIYKLSEINGNHTIFPLLFLFSAYKCPAAQFLPSHNQSTVIKALEPTVVLSLERLRSSARFSISHPERAAGNRLECKRSLCAWNPDVNSVLLLMELRPTLLHNWAFFGTDNNNHTVESLPDFRCAILVRLING